VGAVASGTNATALGSGAQATNNNSVALGAGARTTADNQIVLGGPGTQVALPSVANPANRAAQVGPITFVTTDANGNLASSDFSPASLAAPDGRVGSLERQRVVDRRESRQGVAAAMAMTSAAMPSAPGRTSWATNTAVFRGEWAGGFALSHRLDTSVPLAVTAGYSVSGGSNHGLRFGLAGEF
jgi:autotransporter adhesin